ncbi:MAG: hypothetical protein AVDCRST_MAG25-2238, partial [uncultured Rubrobacteraceae bacterium]
ERRRKGKTETAEEGFQGRASREQGGRLPRARADGDGRPRGGRIRAHGYGGRAPQQGCHVSRYDRRGRKEGGL